MKSALLKEKRLKNPPKEILIDHSAGNHLKGVQNLILIMKNGDTFKTDSSLSTLKKDKSNINTGICTKGGKVLLIDKNASFNAKQVASDGSCFYFIVGNKIVVTDTNLNIIETIYCLETEIENIKIIKNELVVTNRLKKTVLLINKRNTKEKREVRVESGFPNCITNFQGSILVGTDSGFLYILDGKLSEKSYKLKTDRPISILEGSGEKCFVGQGNILSVLRMREGVMKIEEEMRLGGFITCIKEDSGYLYVGFGREGIEGRFFTNSEYRNGVSQYKLD